jgi:Chaperone of endosialidase
MAQPPGEKPPRPDCVWVKGGEVELFPFHPGGVAEEVKSPAKYYEWEFHGRGLNKKNGYEQGWICPPKTTPTSIAQAPQVSVGIGATVLIPHVQVGWMGTGTGGGVTSTFSNAQFMPTLEIDVPLTTISVGPAPVGIGVSGNLMIPTGSTSSRNVSAGGFSGTESFKQGVAGSAFVNASIPVGPLLRQEGINELTANLVLGAGVGVNEYKASSVFPGAADNFSTSHTDVVPAFQVGTNVSFAGGGTTLSVFIQDFLPGTTATMPGGSLVSFGTGKAENTLGITAKVTVPLGQLSDVRLKRDIVLVSRLDNGLGLYRYRYLWNDQVYVGVMAQEVAQIVPDAVMRGSDGYLRVNYARLGLNLQTWDEWMASPNHQAQTAN